MSSPTANSSVATRWNLDGSRCSSRREIEQVRPSRSSTIELEDFVELEAIDPVFFEKSYFLAPRRDASKPYRLLQLALERTERVGIGRFVLRTKPHLVAVRSTEEALVLETLYFGDEVRTPAEVLSPLDGEVSERELRLAEQLVEMLATSWDPDRYADEYRDELLRLIAEKAPVETAETETDTTSPPSRVEELMEALKRSVEDANRRAWAAGVHKGTRVESSSHPLPMAVLAAAGSRLRVSRDPSGYGPSTTERARGGMEMDS